jgi:hypothetical protein
LVREWRLEEGMRSSAIIVLIGGRAIMHVLDLLGIVVMLWALEVGVRLRCRNFVRLVVVVVLVGLVGLGLVFVVVVVVVELLLELLEVKGLPSRVGRFVD